MVCSYNVYYDSQTKLVLGPSSRDEVCLYVSDLDILTRGRRSEVLGVRVPLGAGLDFLEELGDGVPSTSLGNFIVIGGSFSLQN